MNQEGELSGSAGSLNHPQEPRCCNWSASFRREVVRARSLQESFYASALGPEFQGWVPNPGGEFGRGRLATSRQGAHHEGVDEGAALCSGKEGAQDQLQARAREVGHSRGAR
jgi:hypothetical protein